MSPKKPIAITMGDPAGIGPELICKLLDLRPDAQVIIFSAPEVLGVHAERYSALRDISDYKNGLALYPIPLNEAPICGQGNPANSAAVKHAIEYAAKAAMSGQCHGVLTMPINKALMAKGTDFPFPGHTEFLAHLGGVKRPVMMLSGGGLRVVPVTIHIPISDVPRLLTPALLTETIRIVAKDYSRWFGITHPRIAVAGLNPHAGEAGRIGHEEDDIITPVLDQLRQDGLNIFGPLPADTMFHQNARTKYDVAICMYHDQALIPVKTLAFDSGTNLTMGLPFLRTSPDHGTAFDIAGKDLADVGSTCAAFDTLCEARP